MQFNRPINTSIGIYSECFYIVAESILHYILFFNTTSHTYRYLYYYVVCYVTNISKNSQIGEVTSIGEVITDPMYIKINFSSNLVESAAVFTKKLSAKFELKH